jgi:hypothetical protein
MRTLLPAIAAVLTLALLIGACEDDEAPAGSPTPEATATATATATAAAEPTPEPTPTPLALEATDDASGFLNEYADKTIRETDCQYDATSARVDCGELGLYVIAPPPVGSDIVCDALTVDGGLIAVSCTGREPLNVVYYPIPQ